MRKQKKDLTDYKMVEKYPMTIGQELYDAWQLHRRLGDPGRLQKVLKVSRPIVERALNYGHCPNQTNVDKINDFFEKRNGKHVEGSSKLINMALAGS